MSTIEDATAEHWQMVTENTGLVWRHVNRMRIVEAHRDDAYQDGLLGLLRAAMKFDPSKGFTFATYADAWIRQAIGRGAARFEGRNYRRAYVAGERYQRPASIDAESRLEDGSRIVDLIPSGDDPVADAEHQLALDALLPWCEDSIDLAVLGTMSLDGAVSLRAIASDHEVAIQTVRNRRKRLRQLARSAVT